MWGPKCEKVRKPRVLRLKRWIFSTCVSDDMRVSGSLEEGAGKRCSECGLQHVPGSTSPGSFEKRTSNIVTCLGVRVPMMMWGFMSSDVGLTSEDVKSIPLSTFCSRPVERARMMTRLFLLRAVCARQLDSGGRAGPTQRTRAVGQSHNPFAEGVA